MSLNVEVEVRRRGLLYERCGMRPVRKTPDGVAGVVYQGRVYPLHTGNAISLEDRSFDKSDCTEFLEQGEQVQYLPPVPGRSVEFAKSQSLKRGRNDDELLDRFRLNEFIRATLMDGPKTVKSLVKSARLAGWHGLKKKDILRGSLWALDEFVEQSDGRWWLTAKERAHIASKRGRPVPSVDNGTFVWIARLGARYHSTKDCRALIAPRAKALDEGKGNSTLESVQWSPA